jgi:Fic family protein
MDIISLINNYRSLKLSGVWDYDRFNEYAIVYHSSAIEGSLLLETETELLLSENITPAGKPLDHSLMNRDLYNGLKFVLQEFPEQLSIEYIQKINAKVMANTGGIYDTPLGLIDSSKGEFRKGNVTAGGSFFPNFDKVEELTHSLIQHLNEQMSAEKTDEEKLLLSFDAHYLLVTIRPFYNGNGRTSRLLMNGIQHKFNLPLGIVFKEDKSHYIDALKQSRKEDDLTPFRNFMLSQYDKHLRNDITAYLRGINQNTIKL